MNFEETAARISNEYILFLYAITGKYKQSILGNGMSVAPNVVDEIVNGGLVFSRMFYSFTERELSAYVDFITRETSLEFAQSVRAKKANVMQFIHGVLSENVTHVRSLAVSNTSLIMRSVRRIGGAMGVLAKNSVDNIEFRSKDTSKRTWKSQDLVRVVVRDFVYQTYIDSQIEKLKSAGVDLAVTSKGDVFSLSGASGAGIKSMSENRSYFHPNSKTVFVNHV